MHKNIHKKIIMYFSSVGHHIISYIAKFEVQISLVRGKIKERNLSRGWIGPIGIVWESKFSLNFV
jgi:hypothetical protein